VSTSESRMKWWHESRFGLLIHWGLYSQLARHEWAMNRERIPKEEYEKLAGSWRPRPMAADEWVRAAKRAGAKYVVLTAKHHEGFCLWDSEMTGYNAVQHGPGRDLVAEFVTACRAHDMRTGLYYSLMDWHHPDGVRCRRSEKARKRFVEFTHGCVRELMSNYGKIDILWYDCAYPLVSADLWESAKLNRAVRSLQPEIVVNDRSRRAEDFSTAMEERLQPVDPAADRSWSAVRGGQETVHEPGGKHDRYWESIMTFNGAWGYQPSHPEDWLSVRAVIGMLRQATAGRGNLMLNVGPLADGAMPAEALDRLRVLGAWLKTYGEAVYGSVDHADFEWTPTGAWTRKGRTGYYWCSRWPGDTLAIGGLSTRVRRVSLVASDRTCQFQQTRDRLVIRGLPRRCPDRRAGIAVLRIDFERAPRQKLGMCCAQGDWVSPFV